MSPYWKKNTYEQMSPYWKLQNKNVVYGQVNEPELLQARAEFEDAFYTEASSLMLAIWLKNTDYAMVKTVAQEIIDKYAILALEEEHAMQKSKVSTNKGKKPIGNYNPETKTYTKWVYTTHRLWKAGGAFTVDKSYLDDVWPECRRVVVWNRTEGKHYSADTTLIREHTWRDPEGNLHRGGNPLSPTEQYALPFMYWMEI